ncbi:MAG: RNA polymerase sigma factor [Saprospiraceae bacterium]
MTTIEFNQHVNKIESLLFGFAMKLTRNKENAKDLMQETMMRCFDKKDRFQEGTNFKSWSTTVMYNSFINHYRKRKTRNKVIKPVEDFNFMVENKSMEGNAYSRIMMKELKNMVGNLKKDYKVPFNLFIEGFQYDEIAEKLDVPMGTIKSRIFYARKKLKGMCKKRYGNIETLRAA